MMSKFLKVGGWRLNMEMVLFVTPERDGEIQVVFSDEQYVRLQDEPMHALLRWLDANSETLPGDGAAKTGSLSPEGVHNWSTRIRELNSVLIDVYQIAASKSGEGYEEICRAIDAAQGYERS